MLQRANSRRQAVDEFRAADKSLTQYPLRAENLSAVRFEDEQPQPVTDTAAADATAASGPDDTYRRPQHAEEPSLAEQPLPYFPRPVPPDRQELLHTPLSGWSTPGRSFEELVPQVRFDLVKIDDCPLKSHRW